MESVSSCTASDSASYVSRYLNKIINGGCLEAVNNQLPQCSSVQTDNGQDKTILWCRVAQADYTLQFAGFALSIAAICIVYMLACTRLGGTPVPIPL